LHEIFACEKVCKGTVYLQRKYIYRNIVGNESDGTKVSGGSPGKKYTPEVIMNKKRRIWFAKHLYLVWDKLSHSIKEPSPNSRNSGAKPFTTILRVISGYEFGILDFHHATF